MTAEFRDPMPEADDEIVAQSAEWVSRIQSGEIEPGNSEDFAEWLARNPSHRAVFRRMLDVFERSGSLAALQTDTEALLRPSSTRRPLPRLLAAAAAVLVVCGLTLVLLGSAESIRTAVGERRLVQLEDGSAVHLNVASAVTVRLDDTLREVELEQGEVLFDVAEDDSRPFVVRTDRIAVTVTGTSFQVSRYADDTTVAVLDGSVSVDVGDERPGTGSRIALDPGEGIRLDASGWSRLSGIDARRLTGWRQGWLYLQDAPVRELVDRLNRQFHGEILVEDPGFAETRISVALRLRERGETLERVQRLLPLRVDERPGERFIVSADP